MTQTFSPPMTAVTFRSPSVGVRVHLVPLTSVDFAREEFGTTLADAQAFVLSTACTGCGMTNDDVSVRECYDCGARGCDCALVSDAHSPDTYFCNDHARVCGGYCCND